MEIDFITGAAEVRIADFDDADSTIGVRVAGTDGDDAGLLLNHVDFDDYIVFIVFARQQLHIDIFEVAQVVQSFHRTAGLEFIERLALLHLQFAEDDFVLRLFIAYQLDVFDDAFRNINMKDAVRSHLYVGDGNQHVALFQIEIFDGFQFLIHLYEVQDAVLRYLHHIAEIVRGENRISGEFYAVNHRIRHQLVRKVYAFRYFAEVRTNLREYAGTAQGCHVVADAFLGDLASRFAGQKRRELRLYGFRNAVKVHVRNGLAHLSFDSCIIFGREVERRITYCYGLGSFLDCHRRFSGLGLVGDFAHRTAGFFAALYINHGALAHAILCAYLRCLCESRTAGKSSEDSRKQQCFLVLHCNHKFLLIL